MIVLALEFSSQQRSVAVSELGMERRTQRVLHEVSDQGSRSLRPLELVGEALSGAGLSSEAVQLLVVGLGPGSYTGIRSAIALAQGWQLAREVQLVGVSTVECLAFQAQAQGRFGRFSIALDAQRQEFYLATYRITAAVREVLTPLRLVTHEELLAELSARGSVLLGPEVTRWSESGHTEIPQARTLAQMIAGGWRSIPGEKLEPIYLRQTSFVKAPPPRRLPD